MHHGTPLAQPPPLFPSFIFGSPARRSGVLDGNRGWPALPGAILRGAAAILPLGWRGMDGWVAKKPTRRNLALKPAVAVAGTATL
ncbi:hypothetical protein HDV63DRAFT_384258 [Trichoderma sp. SZMC 28014]